MHHGYWSYCSGGECVVCNTPWPEKIETPMSRYLKKVGYDEKYTGEFPTGLTGENLMQIRKQLNDEYKVLEGKSDGMQECINRGALEGYNLDNKK